MRDTSLAMAMGMEPGNAACNVMENMSPFIEAGGCGLIGPQSWVPCDASTSAWGGSCQTSQQQQIEGGRFSRSNSTSSWQSSQGACLPTKPPSPNTDNQNTFPGSHDMKGLQPPEPTSQGLRVSGQGGTQCPPGSLQHPTSQMNPASQLGMMAPGSNSPFVMQPTMGIAAADGIGEYWIVCKGRISVHPAGCLWYIIILVGWSVQSLQAGQHEHVSC